MKHCALTLALAFALLLGVAGGANAAAAVPFHLTVAETHTSSLCSPTLPPGVPAGGPSLCVATVGTGEGSHVGRTREVASVVSYLTTLDAHGCADEARTTTLTGANGDQLMLTATGRNCVTGATTVAARDVYTVTGGTGRFRGATGGGTIAAAIDLGGTAVVTFDGTLALVREGR